MKKIIKIIMIVVILAIVIIITDTFKALIFKWSPLFSIRDENLADEDSYVDRGILIDTYYCVKEKDMVKVEWKFTINDYECKVE